MRGCFGVLGEGVDDDVLRPIRESTDATVLPIYGGMLCFLSWERYQLLNTMLCDFIRDHPNYRYIFTVGNFNEGDRPPFFDLYSRFAANPAPADGEVLICAQTYAMAVSAFKLFPTVEFLPLVVGRAVGSEFLDTAFGRLENSIVWYTRHNVAYVDPHKRFDGMTRRAEMEFWFSPAGFLYLAHQAVVIRAYKAKSRRVVVYSRFDLNSPQFLKLIFTFEAIGVELAFVYEDDLAAFADGAGLGPVDIFSRAGDNSLVAIDGETYYSDSADVAHAIAEAQADLISKPEVYRSTKDFIHAFEQLISNADPGAWRRRGAMARQMLEKFSAHPLAQQQIILETFVDRWRTM